MMKSDAQLREEIIRDLPETTDLVERLRAYAGAIASATGQPMGASTMDEAADTITALQARVAKLEGALDDALETARQRALVLFQSYARGVAGKHGRSEAQFVHDVDAFNAELTDALKHPISARAALAEDYCGIVEVNEEDFTPGGPHE